MSGGSSLSKLFLDRGLKSGKPDLTEDMIIEAAKVHLNRDGKLPYRGDATADFGFPETWANVDHALTAGGRGMPGASSLAKLFIEHELKSEKPDLTEEMIIVASQKCLDRTGKLPGQYAGDATADFGFPETWVSVNGALIKGRRGMSGGSSLSKLLIKYDLKPEKPDLSEATIIAAAKKCLDCTGKLPSQHSGDASGHFGFPETWVSVDKALRKGSRGLPGGSALPKLLIAHGLKSEKPDLSEATIVEAAQVYLSRTGKLPGASIGDTTIDFGFPETWVSVDQALRVGVRGLSGGSSLSQLFIRHGLKSEKPDLTEDMIIEAAKVYLGRTGKLPAAVSGDATTDFGFPEKWVHVDSALRRGQRGIDTKGSSLPQLLKKHGLK